jgi:hypothetical protein
MNSLTDGVEHMWSTRLTSTGPNGRDLRLGTYRISSTGPDHRTSTRGSMIARQAMFVDRVTAVRARSPADPNLRLRLGRREFTLSGKVR